MWKLEEGRGIWRNGLNEVLRYAVSGEKLRDVAECESDRGESLIQLQRKGRSFVLFCKKSAAFPRRRDVRNTDHHPGLIHPA